MALPLALCPWLPELTTKVDADGVLTPNSGGFVYTYVSGSSTPLECYTNPSAPLVAYANPFTLDADGQPLSGLIYVLPRAYKFIVQDSDHVVMHTYLYVNDVATTAAATSANVQAQGTTATGAGPYVVLSTDNTVIVNSATANYVVQLPPAANRGTPLVIKTRQNSVRVTPDGAETLDFVAAFYAMPAASSPQMPSIVLNSDGVSGWTIPNSHKLG